MTDVKPCIVDFSTVDRTWLACYHNILYDVVMAVRGSPVWGPTYKDIGKMLPYRTDVIVDFLRHAEHLRYITGKFGHYSKNGGGAKRWFMSDPTDYAEKADLYGHLYAGRVPPYPYDWLNLVAEQGDNLIEYLKANAVIIYERDTMNVRYIARGLADLEVAYKSVFDMCMPYMTREEKIGYINDKLPSPVIMSYYGRKASPLPVDIDRCTGAWRWHNPISAVNYF